MSKENWVEVKGCPVADNGCKCIRGCGGFYRISTDNLTNLINNNGSINTERLCGPLSERINNAKNTIYQNNNQ